MFGAQIYVADLVAIGMAREMGAVMTGVIMAGRTGAAFAANLGTMQVNEEIDALQTLGVSPMDYLVLPRMAAMVLMMPLLCVYADFMGVLGGMLVGVGAFDISSTQYLDRTMGAMTLTHIGIGLFKSVIFGGIVAFWGCMQGLRCGRSAAAVGNATTSAVVIAIVYIVVADGLFAVLTNIIGI
jgi:phospholipid/cholesterol/gamma-HCH transport system permease protein